MRLRSFVFMPAVFPAIAMAAAAGPPPEFVSTHPFFTNWMIGALVSALSLSVLIHGFFITRMLKQFEKNNDLRARESKKLFEVYRALEHRQTQTETHMEHCCGIPGGKRWYDYEKDAK